MMKKGIFSVPEKNLPVKLPENLNLNVKGNPLTEDNNWKEIFLMEKNIFVKRIHWIHLYVLPGIT